MFRKILNYSAILAGALLIQVGSAYAYANTPPIDPSYNSRIMDDVIFSNTSAMSAQAIQAFLNSKVPVCDTNHQGGLVSQPPPYTCLKDYVDPTTQKTAAQLIYDEAVSHNVNPQVVLATLEKEQGLVTDTWPYPSQYKSAMGYGCPESQSICDSQYYGFYNQVHLGTTLLRVGTDRNCGNTSSYPGWSFDPKWALNKSVFVDRSQTVMGTCSTGAFYGYTPHRPDSAYTLASDGNYYYGNYNFIKFFTSWFGGTRADAYDYRFSSATQSVIWTNPGQRITSNSLVLVNAGTETWYPDSAIPAGGHPTRLSIKGYQNSPYADTTDPAWLGTHNQIAMADTAPVAPGQLAHFNFTTLSPYQLGSFVHDFVPVVDGVRMMRDSNMQFIFFTSAPTYDHVSHTIPPSTILPNQKIDMSVTLKNTGQAPWYSDSSIPAGKRPIRLAAWAYQNTPYANPADPAWLGTNNQIMMTPAVVNPGENATFLFSFRGPFGLTNYTFHFLPVLDGVTFLNDLGMAFTNSTPTPNYSYKFLGATNPPTSMAAGSSANVSLSLQNTGNTIWRNETTRLGAGALRLAMVQPAYRTSRFYNSADANWLAPNQVGMTSAEVAPGQTATFNFSWKAPSIAGSYIEHFAPVLDGITFLNDIGMAYAVNVTP